MDHCGKQNRKKNHRERANIFSLVTFFYTGGLFKKALKKDLEEDDLYEVIRSCNSKKNGDRIETNWKIQNQKTKSAPSIPGLLWATFGRRYVCLGFIHLIWKVSNLLVEPLAMSNFIGFYKQSVDERNINDAYFWGTILVSFNIFHCIYIHNYIIIMQELAIRIRTSFSSLIYRKALKLTPTALSDISLGNVVTLITKDVHTFEMSIWLVNDMWIGVIVSIVICSLMFYRMGPAASIGIVFLLSILPLQMLIGKYVSKLRLKVGKKSDERLQTTQETLSAIRIIKMYTWETFFDDKVTVSRRQEVAAMLKAFYLKMLIIILGVLCTRIGFFLLIITYLWLGYDLPPELIFYIISLFRELRHTIGIVIPYGMARGAELYAAVTRIGKILKCSELKMKRSDEITIKPKIELKDITVKIRDHTIIHNVSLHITSGLTLISGCVGSGKSSLLKAILQDYPLDDGTITSYGRISYASQDPWLFPSSIKQNILFGESLDQARYNEVLRVCALQYDFNLLDKKDETIVADKGINLSKGQQARINLARAVYKDSEMYLLDDSLTALDAHVQDFIFQACIKGFLKDKVVLLVTQSAKHMQEADNVIIMDKGTICSNGRPDQETILQLIGENDELENDVPEKKKMLDDDDEADIDEFKELIETEQGNNKKKVYQEVNKKGSVSFKTYCKYFAFGGGFLIFTGITIVFILSQVTESYSDKLLTNWVDWQQKEYSLKNESEHNANKTVEYQAAVATKEFTLMIYSIMIGVSTILGMFKSYILFDFCRKASLKLHKAMSHTIINAVMSFFDSHFIGNILNRFSQDLNTIDEQLPFVLMECFRVIFSIGGVLALMLTVSWTFLIPASVLFAIIILVRMLYIPTGRSLKRLEAASRSPLLGHLNSTLEGLTTIRAYKAEDILRDEFDRHQDLYTSAHFMSTCTMRAFGFLLDSLCSILIALVVARFVFFDTSNSTGSVGLVITQVFTLAGTVQWGVRQWAELENQMTSVERALEYTNIKQENKKGVTVANWPSKGAIKFENVTLTYGDNEHVLKNINFSLEPTQKIGIVGRTGAGKSSIISTLFRLYEVSGKVIIDGIDTKMLSLEFLRQSIAIIPQDPVLFSGSIRSNIDPNMLYTDDDIWLALEKVKIKSTFPSLDFQINESGSNFSAGEKQLVCLARAIIRKNKIVVLDEATANMDPATDALLHSVIKENFAACTVFTIAHRLHTILDADKIMVLDRGSIVEFNDPATLLENKEGMFYQMVQQSGLLSMIS